MKRQRGPKQVHRPAVLPDVVGSTPQPREALELGQELLSLDVPLSRLELEVGLTVLAADADGDMTPASHEGDMVDVEALRVEAQAARTEIVHRSLKDFRRSFAHSFGVGTHPGFFPFDRGVLEARVGTQALFVSPHRHLLVQGGRVAELRHEKRSLN